MSVSSVQGFILGLILCMGISNMACGANVRSGTPDGSEEWGYIEIRPKAHMFWWLYRSPQRTVDNWPLILWLQGGPGASGVAMGNFQEIGPLDTQLQPRNTTWLQKAHLLFVDSPVATGFSYVENTSLVARSDKEAADDLLSFLKEFLKNNTLQKSPLFIVGESYGGKHATLTGLALSKAIAAGDIDVKLGGVLLGDSWISPLDYVLSWGPLLRFVSRLEAAEMKNASSIAFKIKEQIHSGEYVNALNSWEQLEYFIYLNSNGVDFYNFLLDSSDDPLALQIETLHSWNSGTPQHYKQYLTFKENIGKSEATFNLAAFMNEKMRKKLKIIPSNIQWDGQSHYVLKGLEGAFMKAIVTEVDELLKRGETVTIYNGQVDLICATIGTETWVQQLKWSGLQGFNNKNRSPIYCNGSETTKGFVKSYENLHFFWVLGAGHYVPVDQPYLALKMLDSIFNSSSPSSKKSF